MIEDKFADEMLSDEELDNVAGGTRAETREMDIALNKRLYGLDFSALDIAQADHMLYAKSDLESELTRLGVQFKIDVGKDGTGVGEKANEYYYHGVKISHEQLMNIINK